MFRRVMVLALGLGLLVPATASAAKPAVTTGGAASITPTTATLNGKVDANNKATTYFFQFGTTRLYGTNTAETPGGSGANPARVSVPVTLLSPSTTYHYRLVARNADGLTLGKDRMFKTKVQPLGVTLAATPPTVAPGGTTTLGGQLTGTNSANRQVVLLANPYPYTQGFLPAGNVQVTGADGRFAFPVLGLAATTQYAVQMPARPEVVSPIVVVGVAEQVKTDTKRVKRGRRSVTVRFSGTVTPASDGARVDIQKIRNGVWTTVAHTRAKRSSSTRSTFRTRVKIFRSGDFRVVASPSQPQYVAGAGRTIGITVRR